MRSDDLPFVTALVEGVKEIERAISGWIVRDKADGSRDPKFHFARRKRRIYFVGDEPRTISCHLPGRLDPKPAIKEPCKPVVIVIKGGVEPFGLEPVQLAGYLFLAALAENGS